MLKLKREKCLFPGLHYQLNNSLHYNLEGNPGELFFKKLFYSNLFWQIDPSFTYQCGLVITYYYYEPNQKLKYFYSNDREFLFLATAKMYNSLSFVILENVPKIKSNTAIGKKSSWLILSNFFLISQGLFFFCFMCLCLFNERVHQKNRKNIGHAFFGAVRVKLIGLKNERLN